MCVTGQKTVLAEQIRWAVHKCVGFSLRRSLLYPGVIPFVIPPTVHVTISIFSVSTLEAVCLYPRYVTAIMITQMAQMKVCTYVLTQHVFTFCTTMIANMILITSLS